MFILLCFMFRHYKASKISYKWQRTKKSIEASVAVLEVVKTNMHIGLLLNGKENELTDTRRRADVFTFLFAPLFTEKIH